MSTLPQPSLFHESPIDALRELVSVLGGYKKVGALMRPELPADQAGRWVSDCLNTDRREHFTIEQVLLLLRIGREANCHAAMNYLNAESGYAPAEPIDPENEIARLQREFIQASKSMSKTADRIEQLQVRQADPTKISAIR